MDLEECSQITDVTLAHLATGCPSLEKLVGFHSLFSIFDQKQFITNFLLLLIHIYRPYHIVSL